MKHQYFNLETQMSPETMRALHAQRGEAYVEHKQQVDPKMLQARCIIEENSNYFECKMLCMRNRDHILYITPEIAQLLDTIPLPYIDTAITDRCDFGMRRYLVDGHQFWVFKKYEASILHDNLLAFPTFHPYLYNVKKYSTRFFVKQFIFLAALLAVFVLSFTCAIVLNSEIASWIAAGVCMFVAGFGFLFFLKLSRKFSHNVQTTHCDFDRLLTQEHGIPHVQRVTEDTSEVI